MSESVTSSPPHRTWSDVMIAFFRPAVLRMLFLGISAGLPYLLIFSTLAIRLREAGVDRGTVTFLSWAALAYSFKFVWAPLVDQLPVPILGKYLGLRRGWMVAAQCGLILGMLWSSCFDPASALPMVAVGAVIIGFSAATQDIAIDAYRIESASTELQSMMSATYVAGYRIGMLLTGAGALRLAQILEPDQMYDHRAWMIVYQVMAALVLIGVVTVLLSPEPVRQARESRHLHLVGDYGRFLFGFVCVVMTFVAVFVLLASVVISLSDSLTPVLGRSLSVFLAETLRFCAGVAAGFFVGWFLVRMKLVRAGPLREAYVGPFLDFMRRTGPVAGWILALIGIYRISDIVMGTVAGIFYIDIGFTKGQISDIAGFWGIWATILGGFIGGATAFKMGVRRALILGAVASSVTNLLFSGLTFLPPLSRYLFITIVCDNLAGGFALAAFVAYLSSLTSVSFTATQYALFSSLMTLFPKVLAGYSGIISKGMGYAGFFAMTAALTIPVLALIMVISRKMGRSF